MEEEKVETPVEETPVEEAVAPVEDGGEVVESSEVESPVEGEEA